jgi:fatty acid desaturase
MLHEYFHGITLNRYRDNHAVITLWDGIMMTFGIMEVARGMHLSHHKWLNVPAPDHEQAYVPDEKHASGMFSFAAAFDAVRHVAWLADGLRGKKPYVRSSRIVYGIALSAIVITAWVLAGHTAMIWRSFAVLGFTVLVPISLRGAVEHSSTPRDPGFANEYTPFFPIFNVNRHIHHHQDPTVPWYSLEWRTTNPLPAFSYVTHWFRVYITRELVPMQPMPKRSARTRGRHGNNFADTPGASPVD